MVYFDDILVIAADEKQAYDRLKRVLKLASEYGLNIKWSKCQFLHREIEFLGYVVGNGKVQPAESKIRAIWNFPHPKNIHVLQSYLGLTGFVRKYIKNYSLIAKPLTDLTKKIAKFVFGPQQVAAFDQLKEAMTKKPVLAIYKFGAETELHTDASKYALGAILLHRQDDDGQMHPIAYSSIKTNEVQQRYHSYELEAMAVVESVKKYRCYLLNQPFKIFTDCKAFEATMQKRDIPKVARWALILQEFTCQVVHRQPGQITSSSSANG